MSTKKFPIPLSYFSMPLGLFALGLSWRYGAHIGFLPNWAAETLLAAAFVLWLLLVIAYIIKIRFFRPEFLQDLQDLVQCCFISAIPITTMLAGLAALPYQTLLAKGLILLGTAGQLAFAMYRAGGLWRGVHTLDATTPIVYLPTVATNFVSATAMAALGWSDYAWLFLGAGLFSWLSLEAAILSRLRTGTPVNAPVRGIVGIQLAPAFVGCGAYFAVSGGHIDAFALLLIGYGCLQFLLLLRLLPWMLEQGFSPSFWGFSFGLAAMTGCGFHLIAEQRLLFLGYFLATAGSGLVMLLLLATLNLARQGRLWVK